MILLLDSQLLFLIYVLSYSPYHPSFLKYQFESLPKNQLKNTASRTIKMSPTEIIDPVEMNT